MEVQLEKGLIKLPCHSWHTAMDPLMAGMGEAEYSWQKLLRLKKLMDQKPCSTALLPISQKQQQQSRGVLWLEETFKGHLVRVPIKLKSFPQRKITHPARDCWLLRSSIRSLLHLHAAPKIHSFPTPKYPSLPSSRCCTWRDF